MVLSREQGIPLYLIISHDHLAILTISIFIQVQEWFLERYSPLKRHEIESETSDWSIIQSELFGTDVKTPGMLDQLSLESEWDGGMQSIGQHIPGIILV